MSNPHMRTLRIAHGELRRGGRSVLAPGGWDCALPAAVAIVGINGSGKSSLFMLLTQTLAGRNAPPTILLQGRHVQRIGYVPQTPALPAWLRAEQAARLYGADFDALCAEMPALHLDELRGARIATLSLGQRQALAFALALASRAALLVLDEPFAALDFRRRVGALALLQQWHAQGGDRALLVASQSAADLVSICSHFVVLHDGRYVFTGARDDLAGGAAHADLLRACESRLLELLA